MELMNNSSSMWKELFLALSGFSGYNVKFEIV
jgi:hypothetical protein